MLEESGEDIMKDVLTYKGLIGSVHFSSADKVFHGKLEGINDLIAFEGKSVSGLTKAFHEAVNDYLELCKEAGKDPERPYKGSFNIRVSAELHRKAAAKAAMMGMSLNQFVQKALEDEVAV